MHALDEALGHLGAILMQEAPSDDKIIMDHVRAAYVILKQVNWELTVKRSKEQ